MHQDDDKCTGFKILFLQMRAFHAWEMLFSQDFNAEQIKRSDNAFKLIIIRRQLHYWHLQVCDSKKSKETLKSLVQLL